jgi:hypothetical protein
MAIEHMAQVYTEMLNNPDFRKVVASKSDKAFRGWDLTKRERELLSADAGVAKVHVSPSDSRTLHYLIRNLPLSRPVGTALGNAVGRHLGLPVIGPAAGGCDGGCCPWTGRIIFGQDVEAL